MHHIQGIAIRHGTTMTTFCFEYHWTPEDVSDHWKRFPTSGSSNMLRIICGLLLFSIGLLEFSRTGSKTFAVLTLIAAGWIVLSKTIIVFIVKWIATFCDTKISMHIDDEKVTMESLSRNQKTPYSQTIAWTSFSQHGTALEHPIVYTIECGRGCLWIPKRVFAGDEEETEFRTFVSEKMGDRCKFN